MFHKLNTCMYQPLRQSKGFSFFATVTTLCAFIFVLSACSDPKVNRTNFNHIDIGMRYAEVQHMLGTPTWCDDYDRPKECRWGTEDKHIYVVFVARRVVDKQSRGL
ncbi:hypothetical protein [Aliidiomarina indica]|uniref:hypothetical protein n=1 Tax=Aliidiomarina indica TaxID=2749147 RepID=UPI00188EA0F6|nr:hypothetical protein [Aliidiomarina indica]